MIVRREFYYFWQSLGEFMKLEAIKLIQAGHLAADAVREPDLMFTAVQRGLKLQLKQHILYLIT